MNIIVIGGGKVGKTLVEYLNGDGHDVVLIDTNERITDSVQDEFDVMCVCGSGSDIEVLDEAGVRHCDLVISVTQRDELNVLCGIMAKRMGAERCIARMRNPEYYKQIDFMRNELGIDMIVNPEYLAAEEISRILRFPAAIKTEIFAKGRVELAQMRLPENCRLVGMALSEIYIKNNVKVLICAVSRNGEMTIPNGDYVLMENDILYVTAAHKDIAKFMHTIGIDNQRLKTAMLIGGGRISYYLAENLIDTGMRVKIIENNAERCEELAELLPRASVICADGADQITLAEEGIDDVDSFVTLTGIDEENIIISMYAQKKCVDKVVTKINRLPFADMLDTIGIDCVVTPKNITAGVIVGYVRALENAGGTEINALYKVIGERVEAIEFTVADEPKINSIPLRNLRLKKNTLIAAVIRGRKTFIPDGNSTIERGDTVVVFTKHRIKRLADILE